MKTVKEIIDVRITRIEGLKFLCISQTGTWEFGKGLQMRNDGLYKFGVVNIFETALKKEIIYKNF